MLVYSNPRVLFGISFLVTKILVSVFWSPKSSHQRCSVKVDLLKIFSNFTGKDLCWSLFLIKLQAFRPLTLLQLDSNTGVFLQICKNFKSTYFEEHLRKTASGIPSFNPCCKWWKIIPDIMVKIIKSMTVVHNRYFLKKSHSFIQIQ